MLAESLLRISPVIMGHRTQALTYLLGGQDRHVWLVLRQLPMKDGWWGAPLVLQDLAIGISIASKISRSLTEAQPITCNTSVQLQFYEKKWKISVFLFFKSKLLWKLSFDDESLRKLHCQSEKILVKWFGQVPAWVRLAVSHWISKPEEQLMCLQALIFLLIPLFQNLGLNVAPSSPLKPKRDSYYECMW